MTSMFSEPSKRDELVMFRSRLATMLFIVSNGLALAPLAPCCCEMADLAFAPAGLPLAPPQFKRKGKKKNAKKNEKRRKNKKERKKNEKRMKNEREKK